MADIRITQQYVQVAGQADTAALRVIAQNIEVVGLQDSSKLQVIAQNIEVVGLVAQPDLRVSQQMLNVAGSKDSYARVNRLYIEILASCFEYNVEHILALTHGGIVSGSTVQRFVTSTLSLNQQVDYSGPLTGSAENTLALGQDVGVSVFKSQYDVSHTLSLTQSASTPIQWSKSTGSSILLDSQVSYIGPKWLDATNTLELGQLARIPKTYELACGNTIVFDQSIAYGGKLGYAVSNELELIHFADTIVKVRRVTSNLDLTQVAVGAAIKLVVSQLELTQSAEKGITQIAVESVLELTQAARERTITIGPNPTDKVELAPTQITLYQDLRYHPYQEHIFHTLDFTQDVDVRFPTHADASNAIMWCEEEYDPISGGMVTVCYGLQQVVDLTYVKTLNEQHYIQWYQEAQCVHIKAGALSALAQNTLALTQRAVKSTVLEVSSVLTLSHSAEGHVGVPLNTVLELNQEASVNLVRTRTALSELNLFSTVGYVTDDIKLCEYQPFIGSSSDSESPCPDSLAIEPILTRRDHITLDYPWDVPTHTIDLRNPELNNRNRLEFQRINQITRGGTLIIWSDPQWPKNEHITLEFRGLSETVAQNLLAFTQASLGQQVGLTDWEGNFWRVIHLNPDETITRNKVHDISVSMEFEITKSPFRGRCYSALLLTDIAQGVKV